MKIKVVLFVATLLLVGQATHGQHQHLWYDFYEIPQTLLLNPGAKAPHRWHAGIPLVSNVAINAGFSGFTLNEVFGANDIDFNTKINNLVNNLNFKDDVTLNTTLELFYGGFRTKNKPKDYYSFGMYGQFSFINYWPQDLVILAVEGNANNLNRNFSLNHLALRTEALTVLHVGLNRQINEKLNIGVRGKIYSGLFQAQSINNQGSFRTANGQNNILRNSIQANITAQTSGLNSFFAAVESDNAQSEISSWLTQRAFFGGDFGLGADFGFTYRITNSTTITGSILDVGFMRHNKDTENYTLTGNATNEGVEISLPEDLNTANTEFWEELVENLETQLPFATNNSAYVSLRPIQLNASIRHHWGQLVSTSAQNCGCFTNATTNTKTNTLDYVNAVGLQVLSIKRPRGMQPSAALFYQRRFGNFLALKTTVTTNKYTAAALGLGVNFNLGPMQFYVLADNLTGYSNMANMQFAALQFGVNILSYHNNKL